MTLATEGRGQRRCDRNRKRSKRRAIYCPAHPTCNLDSVSQKYPLFAHTPGQLRERGLGRQSASLVVATYGTIPLSNEWLEEFWCQECETTNWYHVRREGKVYRVAIAPPELWQRATGVIDPHGNPSVGEFTRLHARMVGFRPGRTFHH